MYFKAYSEYLHCFELLKVKGVDTKKTRVLLEGTVIVVLVLKTLLLFVLLFGKKKKKKRDLLGN